MLGIISGGLLSLVVTVLIKGVDKDFTENYLNPKKELKELFNLIKKQMTENKRLQFVSSKVAGAGKWIILSGTATYLLTELAEILGEFELPKWLFLIVYLVINVSLFAIAKYIESCRE